MVTIELEGPLFGSHIGSIKISEKSRRARHDAVKAFHKLIERFPTAVIRLNSESHGHLYYSNNKIVGDFTARKPEVPCDVR